MTKQLRILIGSPSGRDTVQSNPNSEMTIFLSQPDVMWAPPWPGPAAQVLNNDDPVSRIILGESRYMAVVICRDATSAGLSLHVVCVFPHRQTPHFLKYHLLIAFGKASFLWSVSYYTSPFVAFYLYRKGYFCMSKLVPVGQYAATLIIILFGVACLRGIGRWTNPEYVQFITILEETKKSQTPENKKRLACYNFDFHHWPVDFSWEKVSSRKTKTNGVSLLKPEPKYRGSADSMLSSVGKLPCQIVSYLIAHSFGRRMLYPGSFYPLQKAMMPMLIQGQIRLVEEVICCEGNAGFYEIGCMNTPLEAGYSVLGWNHPGFAGSTGVPFPQNEANAMDVVMQYALNELGFQLDDIIIYAWSIGGFTATWAAMSYPEVSALVLDASFDDLLPLALKVMPESWRSLVTRTVRQYLNLNNAEQLCK
ncbi:ABHGA protein, partial [Polypterus senegalus]